MSSAPRADVVVWSAESDALDAWTSAAAPGSSARLAREAGPGGAALRFDFELTGERAWAIARRGLAVDLPAHWVLTLRLRGQGPPNELQVKLVDPSGASVWWWRKRDFAFGPEPQRLVLKPAYLELAWGPATGPAPERLGALEVAVTAGHPGGGTMWIEDLRIEPREPTVGPPHPTRVRASSFVPGHEPERALALADDEGWRSAPDDAEPWLELDLGQVRQWGGLVARINGDPSRSRLLASDDGTSWTPIASELSGSGRRWLRAEGESRFIRLVPGGGSAIARLAVVPIEFAASAARAGAELARAAPRGRFPRHLLGEQAEWALVGGDGDERKGLLGADGALEVDAEGFTLEPFVWSDGRLSGWADVEATPSLVDGCLPIPSVEWTVGDVRLRVTAFASGENGRSILIARYVLENHGRAPCDARLFVAVRPFQVTPEWQRLNVTGGAAPIVRMVRTGSRLRVNDTRDVVAVTRPQDFGAADSDAGLSALCAGQAPSEKDEAEDPLGFVEGAFAFDLRLPPGGSDEVVMAVPLFPDSPLPAAGLAAMAAAAWGRARLAETTAHWRARLGRVPVTLPRSAAPFADSLRASLGWILVNREGPRLQPGPRCYRRCWIRDGAITATALAEMGFADDARAFLRWYAPLQLADGRIPCAVDRHGVDPTDEHDSHGEFAWAVVEVYRLTGDEAFLRELWPRVQRAIDAIADLRATRTSDAWRATPYFGLLPPSISHEGYASRPVHSYWDDFFALRAIAAAADAAAIVGDGAAAARIGQLRDAMRLDVRSSIDATILQHGIDFVPGSADLGDLDPTSTAIAFDPCREADRLPRAALERTFERYWTEYEGRRGGTLRSAAYTAYEVRNTFALLCLGWKERALALLAWLVDDQRPAAWRQWPEVSWEDRRAPRFLGDLPHGWVASTFVRALRRMLAYEREGGALVVAAGVPEAWVREEPGIRVYGLATHFGLLDYTMRADGDRMRVAFGDRLRPPPGGVVVESPLSRPVREALVDGRVAAVDDARRVHLDRIPREVELRY